MRRNFELPDSNQDFIFSHFLLWKGFLSNHAAFESGSYKAVKLPDLNVSFLRGILYTLTRAANCIEISLTLV